MLPLMGWIFLVVAALFMGTGLVGMLTPASRFATLGSCPYTGESVVRAARWLGLSAMTVGLGIAGCVLLKSVLFQIASIPCTVGFVTLAAAVALSRRIAQQAQSELEKKAELNDMEEKPEKAAVVTQLYPLDEDENDPIILDDEDDKNDKDDDGNDDDNDWRMAA